MKKTSKVVSAMDASHVVLIYHVHVVHIHKFNMFSMHFHVAVYEVKIEKKVKFEVQKTSSG